MRTIRNRYHMLLIEKFELSSRAGNPEKNLTGYGYGLERKIKNSFGYITGYEF